MNGASPAARNEEFIIRRVFDAPRELVFDAWTRQEHLDRWFGPKGCSIVRATLDLRPGGSYHYGMRTPDGHVMWGKWTFREISRPERLVLVSCFSDEHGGLTVHPGNADWPRETLSTTTFAEVTGGTEVTLHWAPHNASEIERQTFAASHASMRGGWGGTFEQFAEYLARCQDKA